MSNIIYIIYVWANCGCNNGDTRISLSSDLNEAIENKFIIAVLKSDDNVLPDLIMERVKTKEPYKYPFFSYQYYNDGFVINLVPFDKLIFIEVGSDTLRSRRLNSFNSVPDKIEVFNLSGKYITTYKPDTIFTDNIKNKTSVSFFKMLTWGPLFNDCYRECN